MPLARLEILHVPLDLRPFFLILLFINRLRGVRRRWLRLQTPRRRHLLISNEPNNVQRQ